MINIVDILKDCPKGTKLYSPLCGNCRLIKIYDSLGFDVINDTDDVFNFSYDGRYHLNGECCIFPSKENRDWNKFQKPFKDGDIIYVKSKYSHGTGVVSIYKKEDSQLLYGYCSTSLDIKDFYVDNIFGLAHKDRIDIIRFASEIEKEKLFDVIKKNGYKWNAETKTLEKLIVPKFKVGDQIVKKNSISNSYIVNSVSSVYYGLRLPHGTGIGVLSIDEQDEWDVLSRNFNDGDIIAKDERELVPVPKFKVGDRIKLNNSRFIYTITDLLKDRYRVTTDSCDLYDIKFERQDAYKLVPNHKFKVGDRIKRKTHDVKYRIINVENDAYFVERCTDNFTCHMSFKYVDDEYELVPNKFDISTLKPFDKVLVRCSLLEKWTIQFFERYNREKEAIYPYICMCGNKYKYCIPYEDNKHLLNTTDDCDEYYKNW